MADSDGVLIHKDSVSRIASTVKYVESITKNSPLSDISNPLNAGERLAKLSSDLHKGTTSEATLQLWDEGSSSFVDSTEDLITVEVLDSFRGFYFADEKIFVKSYLHLWYPTQDCSPWHSGTISTDLSTGGTVSVSLDNSETITANERYGAIDLSGSLEVMCRWNCDLEEWELAGGECP